MTYDDSLSYLYSSLSAFHLKGAQAFKPGLDNALRLMEHLGYPHRQFLSIHIAGTNGKGSTSHLIAAALQASGLKVGLYTSPHLVDFRERIRINGEMIPREKVAAFVAENKAFLDEMNPSFFEAVMAMAFAFFAEEKVDIAVVEVGLGGRLDATNIITPMVSVITNIGLDHTELLGHTLPLIAAEKAGIIKPGVPCVIGETDPLTAPVFIQKAQECHSSIVFADQCGELAEERRRVAPDCQLHGAYQEKNMQTAYVALSVLRPLINTMLEEEGMERDCCSASAMQRGFASVCTLTGLRGRWETLRHKPLMICDTGHNSHGIRTYVEQLRELHEAMSGGYNASQTSNCHLRIVFGMVNDKDVDVVLSLLPKEAMYYWTQAPTERAIPSETMRLKGLANGLIGLSYSSTEVAIRAALEQSSPDDIIFIGGSNYVVADALTLTMHAPKG